MVDSVKFLLAGEQATVNVGRLLAKFAPHNALIFLNGTLGAGKTTLVRGFLRACGHLGSTKSPTYTLVEPYQLETRSVYHFDLYRLGDPEELEYIGIRDYLDEQAVCIVEWPEKGGGFLPSPDLVMNLSYEGESRSLVLEHNNTYWVEQLLDKLTSDFKILK
ncbi:tRNA (adenosine(37)-N6)-threonylcarbamoyltransferase complex ATPase subunit type 1 TsaE [Aliikangiella sp. IMCC44359]|uniref:tRNA (adenosine(37)-N6)-threonylcarbamoyltransferase complex ATPase subunit type 1 TsaE n=1 Tax=Aliikangiella sp. IMCC44359 TaxID=3459125 RepID=UPI00403A8447